MIVPGLSNRRAGIFNPTLGRWAGGTSVDRRLPRVDYAPIFQIILETRTRSTSGGAWSSWAATTLSRGQTTPPTVYADTAVESEYRWRHPVPRLSNYLKIDWHQITLEYLDGSSNLRQYTLDKMEFLPRWMEYGRFSITSSYNKGIAVPTSGSTPNAFPTGIFSGTNSFRFTWTNASARVVASPFNETTFAIGPAAQFWWDTWAREDLEYAELSGETPAASPKLRFQPVFFEDRDYGWYWRQFYALTGQKAVRGWIPLDDTSAVTSVSGAYLQDPADSSTIYSSLQIVGGKVDTLGTATTTLPVSNWTNFTLTAVPFGAIPINGMVARGIPAGSGLRAATFMEYVWDGTVPSGYDLFQTSTWCVSPTYSMPGFPGETSYYPATKLNLPFWYTRAGDAPVVVDL